MNQSEQIEMAAIVHRDPDIQGGVPVFKGTRVPVATLFHYLAAGDSHDRFLDHFPSVPREQAIALQEKFLPSLSEYSAVCRKL